MGKLDNQTILQKLQRRFVDLIKNPLEPYDLLTVEVSKEHIIALLKYIKTDKDLQFIHLTDITAIHYPNQQDSFAIVYHIQSLVFNKRLRIKVYIDGQLPEIPSATAVWPGANWMERETYDFFGVNFLGHPDLRRILNVDDMEVFPMRKEYPLEDPNRVDKKDLYFGR